MSQAPAQQQASAWNLANGLTIGRIALVPVFAVLLLHDGGGSTGYRLLATGVFVIASVTDRIDGELARSRGTVTDFGKVSDPIADKTLMGMALIGLSVIGVLWWWVTIVVLVREGAITAMRFAVIRHGVIPASRGGKAKTALQALAIGLYVLPLPGPLRIVAGIVMAAAVAVTVVTGVDYVIRARRLRAGSARTRAKQNLEGTLRERTIAAMGEDRDPALPIDAVRPSKRDRTDRPVSGARRQPDSGAQAAHPGVSPAADQTALPVPAAAVLWSQIAELGDSLVHALVAEGSTAATAESLTGGLVSGALTAVAGSSAAIRGGVVAYATPLKASVLGVDADLLRRRGAVDPDVAAQMATGVRELLGATYGLATTGVAGPSEQDGRPVGTVFVAVAGPDWVTVRELRLSGDREQVRLQSAREVMSVLVETMAVHAVARPTDRSTT